MLDAVISHASALVMHGLPIWPADLARVHLTRNRSGGSAVRRWVHVHGLPIEPAEIVLIDGIAVTSLARTVLDIGCAFRWIGPSPSAMPLFGWAYATRPG